LFLSPPKIRKENFEAMSDYGKAEYWDERYAAEEIDKDSTFAEPFDWLFSFADLEKIMYHLLPNKDIEALLIGCGNAPFSIDVRFATVYFNYKQQV